MQDDLALCFLSPELSLRNFAPWKTVGAIVYNESTYPSSIIPEEVNSSVMWPTLLPFSFFCVWVLKVIFCNALRNRR